MKQDWPHVDHCGSREISIKGFITPFSLLLNTFKSFHNKKIEIKTTSKAFCLLPNVRVHGCCVLPAPPPPPHNVCSLINQVLTERCPGLGADMASPSRSAQLEVKPKGDQAATRLRAVLAAEGARGCREGRRAWACPLPPSALPSSAHPSRVPALLSSGRDVPSLKWLPAPSDNPEPAAACAMSPPQGTLDSASILLPGASAGTAPTPSSPCHQTHTQPGKPGAL